MLINKVVTVAIKEIQKKSIYLKSDLAGGNPVYLYLEKNSQSAYYSQSLKSLLDFNAIRKPLKVCNEGLSFLLQSGVIPPPKSIFKDISIIGAGCTAKLLFKNKYIEVEFTNKFPFLNANRVSAKDYSTPDTDWILETLADATINQLSTNKPNFLFHSAGKDSNMIALALANAGLQKQVTLITQKSYGSGDESEISASIARQLGFKHLCISPPSPHIINEQFVTSLEDHFKEITYPYTDFVSLSYPLTAFQYPLVIKSNIIDGSGNDIYMGSTPSDNALFFLPYATLLSSLRPFSSKANSESNLNPICRTQAEWLAQTVGLIYGDSKKLFCKSTNVFRHWKSVSFSKRKWDLHDKKNSIYTPTTIAEVHIRKVRNATDAWNSNLSMPWSDERLASYFSTMPESYLTNRKSMKNKIILRQILKDKIGLDSDAIGKKGFDFNYYKLIQLLGASIFDEIFSCKMWNEKGISSVVKRLDFVSNSNYSSTQRAQTMLHRIYLLSIWLNRNKYINVS